MIEHRVEVLSRKDPFNLCRTEEFLLMMDMVLVNLSMKLIRTAMA